MKIKHIILGFGAAAIIAACGEDTGSDITKVEDTDKKTEKEDESKVDRQVFYQVPTPNEMFGLITKLSDEKPNSAVLNSPDNASNYIDSRSKALNFGIYSADLAYLSSFEMDTDALKYFNVINKLSDELQISSAFEKDFFERIQDNINNGDSLMNMSNETYYNAYAYLEENERGPTLALVVAGGWLEGIYLVTNLVQDVEKNQDVVERIVEQQLTLENLMGFLGKYSDDQDVQATIEDFKPLVEAFNAIELGESSGSGFQKKGGKMVLGGSGTKVDIKQKDFDKIVEITSKIRNSYTGANS